MRWSSALALAALISAPACVRRATVAQGAGLPGDAASGPVAVAGDAQPLQLGREGKASPEELLRASSGHKAEGAFDPLVDDRQVQSLQVRLKMDPQDLAARLDLAAAYEQYGLWGDGMDQYSAALRISRSAPDEKAQAAERAVLGLSRCARGAGRARDAVPVLEEFLKQTPSAHSWDELGLLHVELGDFAAGERAFREAVALEAGSGRRHGNLGHNLLLQGKLEAAEAEFRTALELSPKSAAARNNLGVVLARKGDLAGAFGQFQSAADAATAHNNLAVVLFEAGRYEESRQELVRALAIRPYFAPALANFKLVQERIREGMGEGGPEPGGHKPGGRKPGAAADPPARQSGTPEGDGDGTALSDIRSQDKKQGLLSSRISQRNRSAIADPHSPVFLCRSGAWRSPDCLLFGSLPQRNTRIRMV